MRYRTLMILLAVVPPMLSGIWFGFSKVRTEYVAWQWRQAIQRAEPVQDITGHWIAGSP